VIKEDTVDQNQDQPECSRWVGDVEYLSVAEYVQRLNPTHYPSADELVSASGHDRTYAVLGKIVAHAGREHGVEPIMLYHPDYESVNGWPRNILALGWERFRAKYITSLRWLLRDLERLRQLRRRIKAPAWTDRRWKEAYDMFVGEQREDESPEQALIRRQSASAALFVIEKEYQGG